MEENVIQIKNEIMINVDVSVTNIIYEGKDDIWNLATCSCENGKYLGSIINNDSMITCDEIIEETKTIHKF